MKKIKIVLVSIILILPMLSFSQEGDSNEFIGKWKFNPDLVQAECSNWIAEKTKEVDTLVGNKKAVLQKELNMVNQIKESINFSFGGLLYHFIDEKSLNIISTKGGVSTKIAYEVKESQLILKYPHFSKPVIYRYEFKANKLYIYELVNDIERFAQVLEKI